MGQLVLRKYNKYKLSKNFNKKYNPKVFGIKFAKWYNVYIKRIDDGKI